MRIGVQVLLRHFVLALHERTGEENNNEVDIRLDEFASCSDVVYPIVLC